MAFTLNGRPAAQIATLPGGRVDAETALGLASRIAGVPAGHLAMHKLVVTQITLNMGIEQLQMIATVFDGITRHNPEGYEACRLVVEMERVQVNQARDGL